MTTRHCRECLTEIPPTARSGCCDTCRPPRRHSRPRPNLRHDAGNQHRSAN